MNFVWNDLRRSCQTTSATAISPGTERERQKQYSFSISNFSCRVRFGSLAAASGLIFRVRLTPESCRESHRSARQLRAIRASFNGKMERSPRGGLSKSRSISKTRRCKVFCRSPSLWTRPFVVESRQCKHPKVQVRPFGVFIDEFYDHTSQLCSSDIDWDARTIFWR